MFAQVFQLFPLLLDPDLVDLLFLVLMGRLDLPVDDESQDDTDGYDGAKDHQFVQSTHRDGLQDLGTHLEFERERQGLGEGELGVFVAEIHPVPRQVVDRLHASKCDQKDTGQLEQKYQDVDKFS